MEAKDLGLSYSIVRKLANGDVETETHEYKEGECIQSVAAKHEARPKYKTEECEALVLRTISALKNENWSLSKSLEGDKNAFLVITECTDLEHYAKAFHKLENPKYKTERKHPINDDGITNAEKARMIVYSLVQTWLYENKHTFGSKGGNWGCGVHSGVWADFCLKIKINEEDMKNRCSSPNSRKRLQSHPLTHYYLGVRLSHRCLLTIDIDGVRTQGERFQVSNMEVFLKPTTVGETSILVANYGTPFVSHIESKYERKLAAERDEEEKFFREEAKFFREEAKRVAKEQKRHEVHLENLARQSEEKERKLKARMEAELDETIIAYNAQVQRTKDIIAFNRKHIADPLLKRIEAKEAEQHRIEAERRHDVKMKQKEAERLAKHAAKRN